MTNTTKMETSTSSNNNLKYFLYTINTLLVYLSIYKYFLFFIKDGKRKPIEKEKKDGKRNKMEKTFESYSMPKTC